MKEHGTYTRYCHGCTCDLCFEAGRKHRQKIKSNPDLLQNHKEAQKRYREKNRDKIRKQAKIYRDKQRKINRDYIKQVKESSPCVDCGTNYPYYVMDFDHLSNKFNNISRMITNNNLDEIKAEIDKCEIVCSNCHRERTHKNGIV
jgi:vacuolar-type H+-ATPase catalytic subunit A/Vma1